MSMVKSAEELVFDRFLQRQILLQGYSVGVAQRITRMLNESMRDITQKLERLNSLPASIRSFEMQRRSNRLADLLADLREMNRAARARVVAGVRMDLLDLSKDETSFVDEALIFAFAFQLNNFQPSGEEIRAVTAGPLMGQKTLSQWSDKLFRDRMFRMEIGIRGGLVQGNTVSQIISGIRQGDLATRNAAGALAATAVNYVSDAARRLFFSLNTDIAKGFQWVSVLDDRTSAICWARDGLVLPTNTGIRPPAHPHCRSVLVPILFKWSTMSRVGALRKGRGSTNIETLMINDLRSRGLNREQINTAVQSARVRNVDNSIPRVSSSEWLRGQSPVFIKKALGPARAKLFNSGTDLKKMVNLRTGRPLTLDEINNAVRS